MLGFVANVKKGRFRLSKEVDQACWFSYEDALQNIKADSIAMSLLKEGYWKTVKN